MGWTTRRGAASGWPAVSGDDGAVSDGGEEAGGVAGGEVPARVGDASACAWSSVVAGRRAGETGLLGLDGEEITGEPPGDGSAAWPWSAWRRGTHGDVALGLVPAGQGDKLGTGLDSRVTSYFRMRSSTKAGSVRGKVEGVARSGGEDEFLED